jgi:hypothetical protein
VATICSVPVLPLEGLALKSVAAVALNPAMLLNMVLKQQQQQQRQWHNLQSYELHLLLCHQADLEPSAGLTAPPFKQVALGNARQPHNHEMPTLSRP